MTTSTNREPALLAEHLRTWLGSWPPAMSGITVVGYPPRDEPAWDGAVNPLVGVVTDVAGVVSVPPKDAEPVGRLVGTGDLGRDLATLTSKLADAMQRPGHRFGQGVFRFCDSPAPLPDAGEWVDGDDPRVPPWLQPFNGQVLCAWDDEGRYGAGVGRKIHDRFGHELSVGTEPALQGRGLARNLVAQAARRVLSDGAIPTYLHAPDNFASARVAEAVGFADLGWRVLGLWPAR